MRKNSVFYIFVFGILLLACSSPHIIESQNSFETEAKQTISKNDERIVIPFDYLKKDRRPHLTCDTYTKVQKDSLNRAFNQYVAKAKTIRGKVVSAAIFMVNMDHCIPYAWEPTDVPGLEYVARYTKKGLFLTSIYENGNIYPAWGCDVERVPGRFEYVKNLGDHYSNGLHCSSFVSWCLYNGGASSFEVLNKSFAATYKNFPNTVRVQLSKGYNDIRPGDLLGFDVHIAIVIGVEGDYVIYANAVGGGDATYQWHGVRRESFDRKKTDYNTFPYTFIVQMAGVYHD